MREINVVVPPQAPAEIEAFRAADFAAYARIIKAANVKLDG